MLRKNTSGSAKLRLLTIVGVLFAINAGVVNTLVHQIAITSNAQGVQVKGDEVAIEPVLGTVGAQDTVEAEHEHKDVITTYTVAQGDTLSSIAEKFDISVNTIRWTNDIPPKGTIRVGQELTILPVTGIQYTVKKGDTLSGIAVRFDAKQEDILAYNDIDGTKIKPGMKLIIPDAEPLPETTKSVAKPADKKGSETTYKNSSEKSSGLITPIDHAVLTQGFHHRNAVDFGAPIGTKIFAAKAGKVMIADGEGYNGGYGEYVVLKHADGTQTLYAHLDRVMVKVGQEVEQGHVIGLSGNTGKSTGPHLHFEVIGGVNIFTDDGVGKRYN